MTSPTAIELKPVSIPCPIDITDFTECVVGGNGILDKLLVTMQAHLDQQFKLGRITSTDYASLYLGAYQATLQSAVAYTFEKEKQGYELAKLNAEVTTATRQLELIDSQIASQQAQADLYAQKIVTERAQVDGTLIGSQSAMGSQRDLMKAQTDGFARDAEQKVAKLMLDTWVVRRNSDDTTLPLPTNLLQDVNIGVVVNKMYQGIGATPASVAIPTV
jgi:hypothetical protein